MKFNKKKRKGREGEGGKAKEEEGKIWGGKETMKNEGRKKKEL